MILSIMFGYNKKNIKTYIFKYMKNYKDTVYVKHFTPVYAK